MTSDRIYLIGYSYAGKTTIGKQGAHLLGYDFIDTDKAIEIKYHSTISLLISHYGEQGFRIIEQQMLHNTADMHNVIIATGGGMACYGDNIQFITSHGTAFYFHMTVDQIMERIAIARKGRPLLNGMDKEEKREFIQQHLAKRMPYYMKAHHIIEIHNALAENVARQMTEMLTADNEAQQPATQTEDAK